jgi:hypothetical protein
MNFLTTRVKAVVAQNLLLKQQLLIIKRCRTQGLLPVWPEPQQANPKQSVGGTELGFARLPFEHAELMSEGQVFKHELGMALAAGE